MKYLIVPEDVEVPVGLEQDMIIVKKPVDHTYAESDEILNMMKDLDLLDNVAAVGMKSKDCTVSEIADKMKVKDGEKNAEVAYAGTADKLKLKNLVKSEVNLALFTGDRSLRHLVFRYSLIVLPRKRQNLESRSGSRFTVFSTDVKS